MPTFIFSYLYLFLDNKAQKTCNALHESDYLVIPLSKKRNEMLAGTYNDLLF